MLAMLALCTHFEETTYLRAVVLTYLDYLSTYLLAQSCDNTRDALVDYISTSRDYILGLTCLLLSLHKS